MTANFRNEDAKNRSDGKTCEMASCSTTAKDCGEGYFLEVWGGWGTISTYIHLMDKTQTEYVHFPQVVGDFPVRKNENRFCSEVQPFINPQTQGVSHQRCLAVQVMPNHFSVMSGPKLITTFPRLDLEAPPMVWQC